MAVKVADKSQVKRMWNKSLYFPQDNYIARIVTQDNKPAKSGNPMITLGWEIVNCDPKKIGDEMIEFDGTEFTSWHVTDVKPPKDADEKEIVLAEQSATNAFNSVNDLLSKAGIDTSEGWDTENPPSIKGKILHLRLYGKENAPRKAPTPEQKKAGEQGDPIKDPITGKEVKEYQIQIAQVYGLYDGDVRPF